MQVHHLRIENFKAITELNVDLRHRLVCVTGINGSAKSSIISALAWGLFGRTIDREPHRPHGADDSTTTVVTVHTDVIVVRRSHPGKLQAWLPDGQELTAETQTKLQRYVDEYTGGFQTWRRLCVFMGDDMAESFGASTDAARKRHVEEMLGLTTFDDWRDRASKRASDLDAQVRRLELERAGLDGKVRGLQWASQVTDPGPAPVAPAVDTFALSRSIQDLNQETAMLRAEHAQAARAMGYLGHDDRCMTCGQGVPAPQAAAMRAEVRDKEAKLAAAVQAASPRALALEQQLADAREAEAAASQARSLWQAKATEWQRAQSARLDLAATEEAITRVAQQLADAEAKLQGAKALLAFLGWRGPRGALLDQTVRTLGDLANRYLEAMESDIRVSMASDESSMRLVCKVKGVDQEFVQCSAGERKRVAIALLFAIAEVPESTRNSVLIIDEAFDRLDAAGVAGVCAVLASLSRPVLIITHDESLLQSLPPTRHNITMEV